MTRRIRFLLCAAAGVVLVTCGWMVPAHLRAVDAKAIEQAGVGSASLIYEGLSLVNLEKVGPARLLLQAARVENLPGKEKLGLAVGNFGVANPQLLLWGGADPTLEGLFREDPTVQSAAPRPIVEFLIARAPRGQVVDFLRGSRRPGVQQIVATRMLTNTVHLPPAATSGGQAMDVAVTLAGLLFQGDHFTPSLRDSVELLALKANRGVEVEKLEMLYLDLISLGKRLEWVQLIHLVNKVEDLTTLRQLAHLVRQHDDRLAVLFSAVYLSEQPAAVARYLMEFNETGVNDLSFSLRAGVGGIKELLRRQTRIFYPSVRQQIVAFQPFHVFFYAMLDLSRFSAALAGTFKYLLILAGGFLFAQAYALLKPAPAGLEESLQVRSITTLFHGLFALFFLLVIILLGEPFLGQESQKVEIPFRLQLPRLGGAVLAGMTDKLQPIMNQLTILSLLVFFVLQALIYVACLLKLAEIKRQGAAPRLKLRLLENEEHLFDAGLYLGFVGTILSLILMSLGVVKPSLMAGYSSTSFGIIFVSILKIFHLRPFRRKLILESEIEPA